MWRALAFGISLAFNDSYKCGGKIKKTADTLKLLLNLWCIPIQLDIFAVKLMYP